MIHGSLLCLPETDLPCARSLYAYSPLKSSAFCHQKNGNFAVNQEVLQKWWLMAKWHPWEVGVSIDFCLYLVSVSLIAAFSLSSVALTQWVWACPAEVKWPYSKDPLLCHPFCGYQAVERIDPPPQIRISPGIHWWKRSGWSWGISGGTTCPQEKYLQVAQKTPKDRLGNGWLFNPAYLWLVI